MGLRGLAAASGAPARQPSAAPWNRPSPAPCTAPHPRQDTLPDLPVWISLHARIKATGTKASEAEAAALRRGELLQGRVAMWGCSAFESRSNEGITAQQEEVRREVRTG